MLACLWPGATASGNGSTLETHSPFLQFVWRTRSSRGMRWHAHHRHKVPICPPPWGEEGQELVHVGPREPRWGPQQPSPCVPWSKAERLSHLCGSPSAAACLTHVLHGPAPCHPGLTWLISHSPTCWQRTEAGLSKLLWSREQLGSHGMKLGSHGTTVVFRKD